MVTKSKSVFGAREKTVKGKQRDFPGMTEMFYVFIVLVVTDCIYLPNFTETYI